MAGLDNTCLNCKCYQRIGAKNPNVPSAGNDETGIDLFVVFESPTEAEDRKGEVFSGTVADMVLNETSLVNVPFERMYLSHALRCPIIAPTKSEISFCSKRVRAEIERIKPKRILVLGPIAVKALWHNRDPKVDSQLYTLRGSKVPFWCEDGTLIWTTITASPTSLFRFKNDKMARRTFEDDIDSVFDEPPPLAHFPDAKVILCKTGDRVRECFAKLKTAKIVAFDFETSSISPYERKGEGKRKLGSVAFAFDDGSAYAIPLETNSGSFFPTNMTKALYTTIRKWLTEVNPNQTKIAHNLQFDVSWGLLQSKETETLESYSLCGDFQDSQLLCYALASKPGTDALKVAAWTHLGADKWSIDVKNIWKHTLTDLLTYNALDAYYTIWLYKTLLLKAEAEPSLLTLYKDILVPATLSFLPVQVRGLDIDNKQLLEFHGDFQKQLADLSREACIITGNINWNFGSSDMVRKYFADKGIVIEKRTPKGAVSIDAGSMQVVVDACDDPIAKLVISYRRISKLQSTYVEGMRKLIYDDGKLHGSFKVPGTLSGRTSSNSPNMQNFPSRKESRIRKMVVPPEGYKLYSLDYGQIEAMLFAVVSGDEVFIADLQQGYDIHKEKAIDLYQGMLGWSREDAIKKRSSIKSSLVFPAFYGAGAPSISRALGIDESQAKQIIDSIYNRYSQVKKWQRMVANFEQKYHYVESLYGRRRYAPMTYNEFLNHTTQSTASDMTLSSMIHIGRKFKVALMIHDDLSFILPDDDEADAKAKLILEAMLCIPWVYIKDSVWLKAWVPLSIECKKGDNWCDLKPVFKENSLSFGMTNLKESVARGNELISYFDNYKSVEI